MRACWLLLLIVCCFHTATAQLDSLFRLVQPRPFNGVVLISQNGKTIYQLAHGVRGDKDSPPLQMEDQFIIASVSKQFTAVMVLQLVDKGMLQLNIPVKRYLPDLQYPWADSVTIHQLLNHTSGLTSPNGIDLDAALAFPAGSRFAYANIDYSLLEKILEKVSGQSFETLANSLFQRYGLKHTTASLHAAHLVAGHKEMPDGSLHTNTGPYRIPLAPAGIITNAADLAKWNELLHGGQLLSDSSYRHMTTNGSAYTHSVFGNNHYSYGIMSDENDGATAFWHTGYIDGGFISLNLYYPAKHLSIVMLENVAYSTSNFPRAFFFEKQCRELAKKY
ncbi:serine hydrolase domain-containing protein [Chitinophaga vietnamensis]|uniref:serine hydrolase domain-containing protein n=1 Tax=Chitinophaga vietnamensis TaxID=2593957 RepID=UPI0011788E59|nr:serine hydrolase domain-containing protein [Chitinophaga vietnamensis]